MRHLTIFRACSRPSGEKLDADRVHVWFAIIGGNRRDDRVDDVHDGQHEHDRHSDACGERNQRQAREHDDDEEDRQLEVERFLALLIDERHFVLLDRPDDQRSDDHADARHNRYIAHEAGQVREHRPELVVGRKTTRMRICRGAAAPIPAAGVNYRRWVDKGTRCILIGRTACVVRRIPGELGLIICVDLAAITVDRLVIGIRVQRTIDVASTFGRIGAIRIAGVGGVIAHGLILPALTADRARATASRGRTAAEMRTAKWITAGEPLELCALVRGYNEPMRSVRRNDLSPRVEMLPLIDVIFLLLTFFIYAMLVMVDARMLPVELSPLQRGGEAAPAAFEAVTVDARGQLFFNREPIDWPALLDRFAALAAQDEPPALYVALESQGQIDRGPALMRVIEQARAVGLRKVVLVGAPDPAGGSEATAAP